MHYGTATLLCFLFVCGLTTIFPAGGVRVENQQHGFRAWTVGLDQTETSTDQDQQH